MRLHDVCLELNLQLIWAGHFARPVSDALDYGRDDFCGELHALGVHLGDHDSRAARAAHVRALGACAHAAQMCSHGEFAPLHGSRDA